MNLDSHEVSAILETINRRKGESMQNGQSISSSEKSAEVTNISPFGIWVLVNGNEFFMSYKEYPFFENAPIKALAILEVDSFGNLHWPELDVDIEADTLYNPENYPLTYR